MQTPPLTCARANRILDKLGFPRIEPVETERRRAAWEHRDKRSVSQRFGRTLRNQGDEIDYDKLTVLEQELVVRLFYH
jgi:hypothetical protein